MPATAGNTTLQRFTAAGSSIVTPNTQPSDSSATRPTTWAVVSLPTPSSRWTLMISPVNSSLLTLMVAPCRLISTVCHPRRNLYRFREHLRHEWERSKQHDRFGGDFSPEREKGHALLGHCARWTRCWDCWP